MQAKQPSPEQLWQLVQQALDERRDPLEEATIVELLGRFPQESERVLALLDALQDLRSSPREPAPHSRGARANAMAAAAIWILLGLATWRLAPRLVHDRASAAPANAAPLALRNTPAEFRVEIEETSSLGVRRLEHTAQKLTHSFEPHSLLGPNSLQLAEGDSLHYEHSIPVPHFR